MAYVDSIIVVVIKVAWLMVRDQATATLDPCDCCHWSGMPACMPALFYFFFWFAGFAEQSSPLCFAGRSGRLCNKHGVLLLLFAWPVNANSWSYGWLLLFFCNPSVACSGVVLKFHAKSDNGCCCNHHWCIVDRCFVVVVTPVVTVTIVNSQRLHCWHHCRWPASMLGLLLSSQSSLDDFLCHRDTSPPSKSRQGQYWRSVWSWWRLQLCISSMSNPC